MFSAYFLGSAPRLHSPSFGWLVQQTILHPLRLLKQAFHTREVSEMALKAVDLASQRCYR